MVDRSPEWIAAAAGGALLGHAPPELGGPTQIAFDAPDCRPGDLFVALDTLGFDPRDLAEVALARGAWGLMMARRYALGMERCERPLICVEDVVKGLEALAGVWRRDLGARVVGVTGSVGKTSTKDILSAMLSQRWQVVATPGNNNNEVGVAATILGAPRSTEILVLEMGAWAHGEITELTDYARPELGVIVNIGPSHLEAFGGVTGVARAKAELIKALPEGGTGIIPADEPLLDPHLRGDLNTVRFGEGGDVWLRSFHDGVAEIEACGHSVVIGLSYGQRHNLHNTLAATAASIALGHIPYGVIAPRFSPMRCETVRLPGDITLIDDSYTASPQAMTAALEHLASFPAARRVAVLGDMGQLGDQAEAYHADAGRLAARLGVDELIAVGHQGRWIAGGFDRDCTWLPEIKEAADYVQRTMRAGDVILLKGAGYLNLAQVRIACQRAADAAQVSG